MEHNCLQITGRVIEVKEMRYSPGGIPHKRFVVEHRSRQIEAGHAREAACLIYAQVSGPALCEGASRLMPGTHVKLEGFLARSSFRHADTHLVLHVQQLDCLDTADVSRVPDLSDV